MEETYILIGTAWIFSQLQSSWHPGKCKTGSQRQPGQNRRLSPGRLCAFKRSAGRVRGYGSPAYYLRKRSCRAYFSLCQAVRPKKALIPVPTFAEYEQALTSVGCQVEHVLLREEDGFCMQENFIDWLHGDLDMVFSAIPIIPRESLQTGNFFFMC